MTSQIKKVLAPALMAAVLLVMPAAAKDSGNDAQVQQKLQQELTKKKQWNDVKVAVQDGVATLTGTTKTYADKAKAERKAEHVDGVRSVLNNIQVAGGNVSDSDLFQTIADKLRYDRVDQGLIMGVNRNVTAG